MDPGALAFTAAIALLTGMVFGGMPLVHVLRQDLNAVFRGNERTGTAARGAVWVRSVLVVCQFAFAFVLLIGAGLLTMSFARLLRVDPGFRAENVVTAQVALPRVRYGDDARARNFLIEDQLQQGAIRQGCQPIEIGQTQHFALALLARLQDFSRSIQQHPQLRLWHQFPDQHGDPCRTSIAIPLGVHQEIMIVTVADEQCLLILSKEIGIPLFHKPD